MATYYVQPIIDGWVEIEVDAENGEEAREKITKILEEMNFGELRDVSWDLDSCGIEEY